jgi:precorrin-6A/cobalt-precorrin-6A reductase
MTLLLLGGTADARQLATRLHHRSIAVIYSIAGLVRQPEVECRVVSGGFSQFGGLVKYIESQRIDVILDATHPYASTMSEIAVDAAAECRIPLWRYQRPAWEAVADDDWHEFESWEQLTSMLLDKHAVFFTSGQLPQVFVDQLYARLEGREQLQVLRTAIRPDLRQLEAMVWIEDIGPFELDQERDIMSKYSIDALVSKNSGGSATRAKLVVAREREVPVYMQKRPLLPMAEQNFSDIDQCFEFVTR